MMRIRSGAAALALVAVGLVLYWILGRRTVAPRAAAARTHSMAASQATPSPFAGLLPVFLVPGTADHDDGPESSVDGTVVSSFGAKPIAGAHLVFEREGTTASTSTGADGAFHLSSAQAGQFRLVMVSAPGYVSFEPAWGSSPTTFVLHRGDHIRGVVIALDAIDGCTGVVRGPDDRPIEGADVRILSTTADGVTTTRVLVSDANGEFHFEALADAIVEARRAGFSMGRARVDWSVRTSRRLIVRLGPASRDDSGFGTGIISGTVFDPDGIPIPGALVGARFESANVAADSVPHPAPTTMTDDAGRFTLRGLDAGPHTVIARYGDLAPARVQGVQTGSSRITLRLSQGAVLTGDVTDKTTGKPVASFSVILTMRAGPIERDPYAVRRVLDAQGHYEVHGLVPATYEVTIAADGFAPSKAVAVTIPDPPAPATVDAALVRGATVRGRVVEQGTEAPIANARVELEGSDGSASSVVATSEAASTTADGSFELQGVSSGRRSLTATAAGHDGRIVSVTVPDEGAADPVVIELSPVAAGRLPALELTGIGAALSPKGNELLIGKVLAGSGAESAGLQTGDAILTIDGQSVSDLGFEGCVQHIRGPEGSTVTLGVAKGGGGDPVDVVVTRTRMHYRSQ